MFNLSKICEQSLFVNMYISWWASSHKTVIIFLKNLVFRCIVKDVSSNVVRVSYVNLVVLPGNDNVSSEPPKIIPTRSFGGSKNVLILEEDENTVLDCIASGIPKPVINWIATILIGRVINKIKKAFQILKYHTRPFYNFTVIFMISFLGHFEHFYKQLTVQ